MTPDRGEAERCAPPVGMESGTWHWLEQDGDKPFPAYWTGGSWGISDRWAFPSQMTADGVRYLGPVQPFDAPSAGLERAAQVCDKRADWWRVPSHNTDPIDAQTRKEEAVQCAVTIRRLALAPTPPTPEVTEGQIEEACATGSPDAWQVIVENFPSAASYERKRMRAVLTAFAKRGGGGV